MAVGAALGELGIEFAFEAANFLDQRGDLRRHGMASSRNLDYSGIAGLAPLRRLPAHPVFTAYLLEMAARDRLSGLVRGRRFPPFGIDGGFESSTLCTQGPRWGPFFYVRSPRKRGSDAPGGALF